MTAPVEIPIPPRWQLPANAPSGLRELPGRNHPAIGAWLIDTGETLIDAVHRRTWPTPKGRDSKGRVDKSLPAAVWATPGARDGKGSGSNDRDLTREAGGRLNPTWVEWLMGWPLGWTDCGSPATESFRSWLRAHSSSFGDGCTGSTER